jgi:hypothetical protein
VDYYASAYLWGAILKPEKEEGVSYGGIRPLFLDYQMCHLTIVRRYLTADFKIFPAENLGTFAAGIRSASPVLGFRPSRAFRLATVKVPKFTSETRCPFFRDVVTAPVKACNAVPAATFVIPADAAIFAISSSFVIVPLLLIIELKCLTPCHQRPPIPH